SYLDDPSRRISSREAKLWMGQARDHEAKAEAEDALHYYGLVTENAAGTYEATEAAKAVTRLNDPAKKEARRKARESTKAFAAAAARASQEKAIRAKIGQKLKLGRTLEENNPKAAVSYYREILDLAKSLSPEPEEVMKARSRLKALQSHE